MFLRALRLISRQAVARPWAHSGLARSFSGRLERQEFRTETKELLNIVARSLYTDKEVFMRELVSNASDALEKLRLQQVSGTSPVEADLRIKIRTNDLDRTIVIEDTGIGMSREELIDYLGTIAKSGSKRFVEQFRASSAESVQAAESIIGQFGVGFYSSFIVAEEVTVESRKIGESSAYLWRSQGQGDFEIGESEYETAHGTKITIKLQVDSKDFSNERTLKEILQKYSQFVSFPIELNQVQVNTLTAIWTRPKNEVGEEEYTDFYKFLTSQQLPHRYVLHYNVDVPVTMHALIYVPQVHSEKFGMNTEEQDISLYSRKVLIQQHCKDLLPNWLRFVKGVVDCEDLPLNVSREKWQDSALMSRVKGLLSKRIIRFLIEQANRDETKYLAWYNDFQSFIKEGLAMDPENSRDLVQLARFNWSLDDRLVSLSQYITQMKEGQRKIYFLFSPVREAGMHSPYLEPFLPKNVPVLFSSQHVDEMIFRVMADYQGFRFVNIESSLDQLDSEHLDTTRSEQKGVPDEELVPFTDWIKATLGQTVTKVVVSSRLKDSPCIVVGEVSSGLRQVMRMMDKGQGDSSMRDITLEINFQHPIVVGVNRIRFDSPDHAKDILGQIFDNALLQAGLFENSTGMIKRINRLLEKSLESGAAKETE
jgi:HSP90 family molecular chaperone